MQNVLIHWKKQQQKNNLFVKLGHLHPEYAQNLVASSEYMY